MVPVRNDRCHFFLTGIRLAHVRALLPERGVDVPIEVDGRINGKVAPSVVAAGILVTGSALFQHPQGLRPGIGELLSVVEPAKR